MTDFYRELKHIDSNIMKPKLKIEIVDNKISLFLLDKNKNIISKTAWTDDRDLSEKLLRKIDLLLRKNKLAIHNISKFDFVSSGKCGFTARQIGEITVKILNFRNSVKKLT